MTPKVIKAFSTYKVGEHVKENTDPAWQERMIRKGYLAPIPDEPVQAVKPTPKPEPVAEPEPEPVVEATTDRPNLRKRKTEPAE